MEPIWRDGHWYASKYVQHFLGSAPQDPLFKLSGHKLLSWKNNYKEEVNGIDSGTEQPTSNVAR